ncbi:MAG: DUF1850 domain-containing protein [Candidatus Desulforudis sp.]|nr:DUF1850 domain-containing protein [Desulforudis sp.]
MTGGKKGRASIWGASSLFLAGILAVFAIVYGFAPQYQLAVGQPEGGRVLYRTPVRPGEVFTYYYVHSVEQTTVYEHYRIGDDFRIVLTGTEFSSLGAGLPSAAEGRFETGDGTFILTGLDRSVDVLRLKPTSLTECRLQFENRHLDLDRPELDGRSLEVRVIRISRFASWRWTDAGPP